MLASRLPQRSAVVATGRRIAPMRAIAPVAAPSMPSMSCVMGGLRLGERVDASQLVTAPSSGMKWTMMRHGNRIKHLGRPADQRKALIRGLVTQVILHGEIRTTKVKAKVIRKYVDHMITLAKDGSLHARRQALGFIYDPVLVQRLFEGVKERYGDRNGGYTRVRAEPFTRRGHLMHHAKQLPSSSCQSSINLAFLMDSQPRSNASPVWKWVIDDVCTRMKPSFIQEGIDASVLDDLRKQWESKMVARGLIDAPVAPAAPQQPQAVAQATLPPPLPPSQQQRPAGSSAGPQQAQLAQLLNNAPPGVQQLVQQLMQQARAARGAGAGGGGGGAMPALNAESLAALTAGFKRSRADQEPNVPQRDGPVDNNQGAGTSSGAAAAGGDDDEEELSEDSQHEEEQSFENYLICQFEKVNRTSGGRKWKVMLKDGVLHSNGKDYVFTKATGEWSWT